MKIGSVTIAKGCFPLCEEEKELIATHRQTMAQGHEQPADLPEATGDLTDEEERGIIRAFRAKLQEREDAAKRVVDDFLDAIFLEESAISDKQYAQLIGMGYDEWSPLGVILASMTRSLST